MQHPRYDIRAVFLAFLCFARLASADHLVPPPPEALIQPGPPSRTAPNRCQNPKPFCTTCSDSCCRICAPDRRMNFDQAFNFCAQRKGRPTGTSALLAFSQDLRGITWSSRSEVVDVGIMVPRPREVAVAIDTNGNVHQHRPTCRHYVSCEFTTFW